jgi:hypothetical protein
VQGEKITGLELALVHVAIAKDTLSTPVEQESQTTSREYQILLKCFYTSDTILPVTC